MASREDGIEQLMQMFGTELDRDVIERVLDERGGQVERAIDRLLNLASRARKEESDEEGEEEMKEESSDMDSSSSSDEQEQKEDVVQTYTSPPTLIPEKEEADVEPVSEEPLPLTFTLAVPKSTTSSSVGALFVLIKCSESSAKLAATFNQAEHADLVLNGFHVHRAFLAQWSPSLLKAITTNPSELLSLPPEVVPAFLRLIYLGVSQISLSVLIPFYAFVKRYDVPELLVAIRSFFGEVPASALAYLRSHVADAPILLEEFSLMWDRMFADSIDDIIVAKSHVVLSLEDLTAILASDSLPIGEFDAFQALLEWIKHDLPRRKAHLVPLLRLIRFPLMRPEQLVQANEEALAYEDPTFRRSLFEAFLYVHGPREKEKDRRGDKRFQPRTNTKPGEVAFRFLVSGKVEHATIPATRSYRILAKGAKAADGSSRKGGRGAVIEGVFALKKGDVLFILCGASSERRDEDSGGGGGTFVAVNARSHPLIVAGGGGGTRGGSSDPDGLDASLTEDGRAGVGSNLGKGGQAGQGGHQADGSGYGGGGGGFFGNGVGPGDGTNAAGQSFVSGGAAFNHGGFGGGGGCGSSGGGGGGGYSGGGGGRGGGGGGSFVRGDATSVSKAATNDGEGECIITYA